MLKRHRLAGVVLAAAVTTSAYAQTPSAYAQTPSAYAQTPSGAPSPSPSHEAMTADPGFKATPAPADAYCYIGWPNDGEVLHSTHVKVWFGTRNFGVAPAGTDKPNTGHHHLLIDVALPPLDQPIPNDKNHLHYGLGQTEAVVDLPPGTHTLQLLMGDANHIPHNPPVLSKKITIHVRATEGSVANAK